MGKEQNVIRATVIKRQRVMEGLGLRLIGGQDHQARVAVANQQLGGRPGAAAAGQSQNFEAGCGRAGGFLQETGEGDIVLVLIRKRHTDPLERPQAPP